MTASRIIVGDAARSMATIADGSIDMILTSPPYFRLRDYAVDGQLGTEPTVDAWVAQLRLVAAEARRVLVPTGTLWLNLGDTFSTKPADGAGRKSLLLGPERLALSLIADGWMLRNKLVWQKANPMPTSVNDRLAATWEVVYVFSRSPRYFFDLDAVRVPHRSAPAKRHRITRAIRGREEWRGPNSDDTSGLQRLKQANVVGHPLGKNPGDVWTIASSNYRGSHHATFPVALASRAIRAGCPEQRCQRCRSPWRSSVVRALGGTATRAALGPTCHCASASEPGVVLDPFIGSGTTAIAAEALGRTWLGVELNPDFAAEACRRITAARETGKVA